jgi:hypothetical protein
LLLLLVERAIFDDFIGAQKSVDYTVFGGIFLTKLRAIVITY